MDADRVLEVLAVLATAGIPVWLDGGWAIDALLGEQTRQHDDLDLVARLEDSTGIEQTLRQLGYTLAGGGSPLSFELVDADGHQVDVHPAAFNTTGDNALVPDRLKHARVVKIAERSGHVPSHVWVVENVSPAGHAFDPSRNDQQRPFAGRFDRRHPTGEPRSTKSKHGDALPLQFNSCLRCPCKLDHVGLSQPGGTAVPDGVDLFGRHVELDGRAGQVRHDCPHRFADSRR